MPEPDVGLRSLASEQPEIHCTCERVPGCHPSLRGAGGFGHLRIVAKLAVAGREGSLTTVTETTGHSGSTEIGTTARDPLANTGIFLAA